MVYLQVAELQQQRVPCILETHVGHLPGGVQHGGLHTGGLTHGGFQPGQLPHRGLQLGGLHHEGLQPRGLPHGGLHSGGLPQGVLQPGGLQPRGVLPGGISSRSLPLGGMNPGGLRPGVLPGGLSPGAEGCPVLKEEVIIYSIIYMIIQCGFTYILFVLISNRNHTSSHHHYQNCHTYVQTWKMSQSLETRQCKKNYVVR